MSYVDIYGLQCGECKRSFRYTKSYKRYEFVVQLDVPEDDELYVENGVSARAIIKVDEDQVSIVSYDLQETTSGQLLDFDMEEDEEEALLLFCKEHLPE